MKTQIRSNVFETNSSSTHSICISKDPVNISDIEGKTVVFTHGQFGWEWEQYTSLWSKASYLYQAICDVYRDEKERSDAMNQIYEILGKYGIDCEFEPTKKDHWCLEYGYIDHGSELKEFVDSILHSENRLLRYLFGDTIIFTGNDNDDPPELDWGRVDSSKYERYDKWD